MWRTRSCRQRRRACPATCRNYVATAKRDRKKQAPQKNTHRLTSCEGAIQVPEVMNRYFHVLAASPHMSWRRRDAARVLAKRLARTHSALDELCARNLFWSKIWMFTRQRLSTTTRVMYVARRYMAAPASFLRSRRCTHRP